MRALALVAVLCAASTLSCRTGSLFGPETVVVPVEADESGGSSWSGPRTCPQTEIVGLESVQEAIPAGVSPDDAFRSVAQFTVGAGISVRVIDHQARTLETEPFAGQTISLGCDRNEYRVYVAKVAVSDTLVLASLKCYRSLGWEPHVRDGVAVGKYRTPTEPCSEPAYIGSADASILPNLVGGAFDLARAAAQ